MGKTYKMGLLPGDGTGPEVLREGMKVLNAAAAKFGFKFETTNYDIGGERFGSATLHRLDQVGRVAEMHVHRLRQKQTVAVPRCDLCSFLRNP